MLRNICIAPTLLAEIHQQQREGLLRGEVKIMVMSSHFHCSHSLKQKADSSVFTASNFLMSTDVSYNFVMKDTAPRLHVCSLLPVSSRPAPAASTDRGSHGIAGGDGEALALVMLLNHTA